MKETCSNEHMNQLIKKKYKRASEKAGGEKDKTTVQGTDSGDGAHETGSSAWLQGLFLLAIHHPTRQFDIVELSFLVGIGRPALSKIKNHPQTPFSLGKCSLTRLEAWLAKNSGFKQVS